MPFATPPYINRGPAQPMPTPIESMPSPISPVATAPHIVVSPFSGTTVPPVVSDSLLSNVVARNRNDVLASWARHFVSGISPMQKPSFVPTSHAVAYMAEYGSIPNAYLGNPENAVLINNWTNRGRLVSA